MQQCSETTAKGLREGWGVGQHHEVAPRRRGVQAVARNALSDRVPLVQQNRDKAVEIGVLEVTASLDNVYRRLFDRQVTGLVEA